MGGVAKIFGSLFGASQPKQEAIPSVDETLAARDKAAKEEERKQRIAGVKSTGRSKLNNSSTGSLGVVDGNKEQGGLF